MSWLTDPLQRQSYELVPNELEPHLLMTADNDFIEKHPRFAKRNDILPIRRIVGQLRISMYGSTGDIWYPDDALVEYGLCYVEGQYDPDGTWNMPDKVPDPREMSDEDDKWLFKNSVVLSFGTTWVRGANTGGAPFVDSGDGYILAKASAPAGTETIRFSVQPSRPVMLSTDQQLPNGSLLDIKTRRKTQYGEKLCLITYVTYSGPDAEARTWYAEPRLRVLAAV